MVKHNKYASALVFSIRYDTTSHSRRKNESALPLHHASHITQAENFNNWFIYLYLLLYCESLEGREWDFFVFPPETSTVSGTNIMAKYIFVDDWPVIALWLQWGVGRNGLAQKAECWRLKNRTSPGQVAWLARALSHTPPAVMLVAGNQSMFLTSMTLSLSPFLPPSLPSSLFGISEHILEGLKKKKGPEMKSTSETPTNILTALLFWLADLHSNMKEKIPSIGWLPNFNFEMEPISLKLKYNFLAPWKQFSHKILTNLVFW